MAKIIRYPLTDEAKAGARDLVEGWNDGVLPQTLLFGHHQQGKKMVPMFYDLTGNQINFNKAPQRGAMFELAQFNLVMLRTFPEATTLEVIFMQELRNAVASDFVVSEYFLTLNSAGVLNIGGTVNIADAGARLMPTRTIQHIGEESNEGLALLLREQLGPLPMENDDLDEALLALEIADDADGRGPTLDLLTLLGRLLNRGEHEGRVMEAVDTITRHMGGREG